jgi:hypothetical protein
MAWFKVTQTYIVQADDEVGAICAVIDETEAIHSSDTDVKQIQEPMDVEEDTEEEAP